MTLQHDATVTEVQDTSVRNAPDVAEHPVALDRPAHAGSPASSHAANTYARG